MTLDFLTKTLLILVTLLFQRCESLTGEYHVSIRLTNGSYFLEKPLNSGFFPNLEVLFKIHPDEVQHLQIEGSDLHEISSNDLKKYSQLTSLVINHNKELSKILSKSFVWNSKLSYLNFDGNSIDFIAHDALEGLFKKSGVYAELHLSGNQLQSLPIFNHEVPGLTSLTVSYNPIRRLRYDAFVNTSKLEELYLKGTRFKEFPGNLLKGLSQIYKLDLSENENLEHLHPNAFVGADSLLTLNLNGTSISYLPYDGLGSLQELSISDTPNLWNVPDGIIAIPSLKTVRVSSNQRFLCCAFEMKRSLVGTFPKHGKTGQNLCPSTTPFTTKAATRIETSEILTSSPDVSATPTVPTTEDPFGGFGKRRKRSVFEGFRPNNDKNPNTTAKTLGNFNKKKRNRFEGFITKIVKHSHGAVVCNPVASGYIHYEKLQPVECTPEPDALRPCDDIMGNVFLTGLSWLVSTVALLGNAMVFSVLILSRRTVTVTKFLLINLSFADLVLAVYLFILVSVSGHTHGKYYNYVHSWQYGGGCALSGFLAIFSSQLSMLILVVITVERYFAIVYAMHFQRRVTMKMARRAVLSCWLVSLIMAILPLFDVNSYEEVALCLPFKVASSGDKAYIGMLLIMNLIFFVFVLVAYIRMYCVVRSPHLDSGPQRNDSEVAKRMALLVFTDFFCWGPIAFVGIVSAFGSADLINMDVKKSKYLLVIFFPINALCNPFLYAVSTNTFKRDLFDLLIRCGVCQDSIAKANEGLYGNSCSHKNSTRNSETIVYHSQVSRSSTGNKRKHNLLTRLLIQRHVKKSSESPLILTPMQEISPVDGGKYNQINDDVFYTNDVGKMTSEQSDSKSRNSIGSRSYPGDDDIAETQFVNNNKCIMNSKLSEYDLVDQVFDSDHDSVDEQKSVEDKHEDEVESRSQNEAVSEEHQTGIDRRISGISQYDLSPEAFRRCKTSTII